MTTQAVQAQIQLSTGEIVDLQTTVTDGQSFELKTSGAVIAGGGISAQSLGTYADGKTISAILQPPTPASGSLSWAYIQRNGAILACLPVSAPEVVSQPIPFNVRLRAGDTIQVFSRASATPRDVALNVVTAQGTQAIFSVVNSASTTNNLTHILNSQSLGENLAGQTIVSHYGNSTNGSTMRGGSILYINDRGLPAGSCMAINPFNLQIMPNSMATATIGLNFQASTVTTA